MQSFELFQLYSPNLLYSRFTIEISTQIPGTDGRKIAASPERIVTLSSWKCAAETSRLVRAQADHRDIVLLSRLAVGNFIFPFIQAALPARCESRVALHDSTHMHRKQETNGLCCNTGELATRVAISDFVGSMIAGIQLTPRRV